LATTTSRRRGVARNVVVIVLWRYSPLMPKMPRRRATAVTIDAGAPIAWTKELLPSGSFPWWPALLNTAMVTSAVRIGAAAKPVMKTGVVRCFRSSVRTRRIMLGFLPFR
jgi:hypothetical protein